MAHPRNGTTRKQAARGPSPGAEPAPPPDARSAAIRAVAAQAARFPDLLPAEPETDGLDPRDAALAHAIYDAVIRRWLTLAALIAPHLNQPFDGLEPKMRAVLLCGAAQLALLDRIPPHAAVDESVGWAKRFIRPGAGGMVNAVLRRVHESLGDITETWADTPDLLLLPDGRGRRIPPGLLPADPIDRLAVQASLSIGMLRRWVDARGTEDARRAAFYGLASPPITLNTRFADGPVPSTEPHAHDGHAVFTGSMPELRHLLAARPDVWVQDAASGRAVRRAAETLKPRLVVDLCAGRGTKTRQLAFAFPEAEIVAADVDKARAAELAAAFAGHPRVRVLAYKDVLLEAANRADLILLDVPCSNSGVIARRPEAKYRFGRDQMKRLTGIQRQILADSVAVLAPAGQVLYSTCSLEPEEDAEPLDWARQWHGLRPAWTQMLWPRGGPDPGRDPPASYHDGSFSALLSR